MMKRATVLLQELEINSIGCGSAKFGMDFVRQFGYQFKTEFYIEMVRRGVGETVGTIKP